MPVMRVASGRHARGFSAIKLRRLARYEADRAAESRMYAIAHGLECIRGPRQLGWRAWNERLIADSYSDLLAGGRTFSGQMPVSIGGDHNTIRR